MEIAAAAGEGFLHPQAEVDDVRRLGVMRFQHQRNVQRILGGQVHEVNVGLRAILVVHVIRVDAHHDHVDTEVAEPLQIPDHACLVPVLVVRFRTSDGANERDRVRVVMDDHDPVMLGRSGRRGRRAACREKNHPNKEQPVHHNGIYPDFRS